MGKVIGGRGDGKLESVFNTYELLCKIKYKL